MGHNTHLRGRQDGVWIVSANHVLCRGWGMQWVQQVWIAVNNIQYMAWDCSRAKHC